MSWNIGLPTRDNVGEGDLVLLSIGIGCSIKMRPIIATEAKGVIARDYHDEKIQEIPYDSAIVLKRDGSYLVGRNIQGNVF